MREVKVYAVNSGIYSDYGIDAIFSTRKLAEDFMKAFPDNDYNDISEYTLDPPSANLIRKGYSIWGVIMLRDGTVENVYRIDNDKYNASSAGNAFLWERTKALAYKGKNIPDALNATVWGKTEKHAIKIVNEKRTKMIAEGKWK